MRQIDRLPFVFAIVLFLLAWLLGFPMRAQSAPLGDVECTLIQDAAGPTKMDAGSSLPGWSSTPAAPTCPRG